MLVLSVRQTKQVLYGTPTDLQERNYLRIVGFVHVTFLATYSPGCVKADDTVIGEMANLDDRGRWAADNGAVTIMTIGGEIWLYRGQVTQALHLCVKKFAPKGKSSSMLVPTSNGQNIRTVDLLRRMSDPSNELVYEKE